MPQRLGNKSALETGEWMTVTFLGKMIIFYPIYEPHEQAKEAYLVYNECKIEEYEP